MNLVREIYKEIVFWVKGSVDMRLPELIEDLYAQIEEKTENVSSSIDVVLLRHNVSDLIEVVRRFHSAHKMIDDLNQLDNSLLEKLKELKHHTVESEVMS